MRRLLGLALLSMVACLQAPSGARADCERHIYNNASCDWLVSVNASAGSAYVSGGCVKGGTVRDARGNTLRLYRIAPGCTANLSYTTTGGQSIGNVILGSAPSRRMQSFAYSNTMALGQCPVIGHSGRTANFSLNDGADGDITIFGGCPAKPAPPKPVIPTRPECRLGLCP